MSDRLALLVAPALLTPSHDCSGFNSGEPVLDEWLQNRALNNIQSGASRTYVVCQKDSQQVLGYYALCMGQILGQEVTGSMRRNMPKYIPAVILGRLAIDQTWQGNGLGRLLMADVVQRSLRASSEVAARLIIVHAISMNAEAFYLHHGFTRLPAETSTLALDLVKLQKQVKGPSNLG
jgi:GNAT superfamily N-acetyltransferase